MNHLPYKNYKNSGIEWIGDIPESWNIDRIKAGIKACKNGIWGEEPAGDASDTICVRVADFNRDNLSVDIENPTLRSIQDKEKISRTLKKGDLLLEKSGGGENQPVGCVVLYNHDAPAVCSNFIARMSLKDGMYPEFWKYLHAAAYSIRLTVGSINQTSGIQNLDQDRYFNEKVPFPPLGEQQAIANFLDRETAKIDELIQKQEKLIEALNERRTALICERTTLGLNKDADFFTGEIPWLHKIPNHWEISPLFAVAKENLQTNKGLVENNLLSLSYGRIIKKDIDSNDGLLPESFETYQVVDKDYIVFRLTDLQNDKRSLRSAIAREKGIITSAYLAVIPYKILPEYFNYLMRAYDLMKVFYSMGGGLRQSMKFSDLRRLPILVPPPNEQLAIVQDLNLELKKQDELIEKASKSIELLKEHRASLISAAVTGKIDVRNLYGH